MHVLFLGETHNFKRHAVVSGLPEIELPSCVTPQGFHHGDQVLVKPLTRVRDAVSVQLEPLTTTDWELIEHNAQLLEEGGFLRQVSLIYPNQMLSLRVSNRDVAQVVVLPHTDESLRHIQCWRLSANTEVSVKPPSSINVSAQKSAFETHRLRTYPTWLDYHDGMRKFAEECQVDMMKLENRGLAFVCANTFQRLLGRRPGQEPLTNGDSSTLANAGSPNEVLAKVESTNEQSSCYHIVRVKPLFSGVPPRHIGMFYPTIENFTRCSLMNI